MTSRAVPALVAVGLALALTLAGAPPAWSAKVAEAQEGSTRTLYLVLIRQARIDGKPRAALAYLDDFDRHHPGDREAQVLRVNCLLDLGQVDAAQAALGAIRDGDKDGEALAARGHVYAAQENWAEAARTYAAAQAARPADAMIGNALGYAQLRAGETAQSVETLRRALDLLPRGGAGESVVRNNLALALTLAGRDAEAGAVFAHVRNGAELGRLQARLSAEAARLRTGAGGER